MSGIEREEKKREILAELKENFKNTKEHLDVLFQCLGDESWRVRKEAIQVALKHPSEEVIKILIEGLNSEENAGLRNAAQEALTQLGTRVITYLTDYYSSANEDVRKFILDILGDIGDKSVCEFLIRGLADESENVVISACENIGKIKCEIAIPHLLNLIDPKKEWLSFVILEAIAQIGKPFDAEGLLPLFDIPQMRKPLLDLVRLFKPPHNLTLLKKAFREGTNYVKLNAVKRLFELFEEQKESLPLIKDELKDFISGEPLYNKLLEGDERDAKSFALITYITENGSFLSHLIERADDETLEFFGTLIRYAPFKNKEIIKSLLDCFDGKRQAYVAYLCGVFLIPEAKNKLIELCSSPYGHTRQAIAYSLGKLGGDEAKECLLSLLTDPYEDVREQAVHSLSLLINKDNFPYERVEGIFYSNDRTAIYTLLDLLYRTDAIKEEHLYKALRSPFPEIREKALKIIGLTQKRALMSDVLLHLTDENETVRISAIECLGEIGDENIVPTLAKFLSSEDLNAKKVTIESINKIAPHKLSQYEDLIFGDITPFSLFSLLTLLEKGINLSEEQFIKKALEFDEKDIYIELINYFTSIGLFDAREKLISILEKEKGPDYLPPHLLNSPSRSN